MWPWRTIAVSGSEPPVVEMYPFGEGTTVRRGSLTVWSTNFDCDNSPQWRSSRHYFFHFCNSSFRILVALFFGFHSLCPNGAPLGIQDRRRVQVVVAKHCFALGRVVTQCDGRFMCAIPKHECRSSIRLRIPGVTRRNGLDQTFHLLGSPNGLIRKGAAFRTCKRAVKSQSQSVVVAGAVKNYVCRLFGTKYQVAE